MNQKYKAKIKEKVYSSNWRERTFEFSNLPFQHYLDYYQLTKSSYKDGGRTRENIVSDLHKIKGFKAINLATNSLKSRSNEYDRIPDPVIKAIEDDLGDDASKLSRHGIPDLLVYKLPKWHQLTNSLPPIQNISFEDNKVQVETSSSRKIENSFSKKLCERYFFVEVKRWEGSLNENQEEWFEEFGEKVNCRVFYLKHLENIKDDFEEVDFENPWEIQD